MCVAEAEARTLAATVMDSGEALGEGRKMNQSFVLSLERSGMGTHSTKTYRMTLGVLTKTYA